MRFLTTSDLVELHGNKRVGHAAMETLLVLNGYEMDAGSQEQEQVIIAVAAGQMGRRLHPLGASPREGETSTLIRADLPLDYCKACSVTGTLTCSPSL